MSEERSGEAVCNRNPTVKAKCNSLVNGNA